MTQKPLSLLWVLLGLVGVIALISLIIFTRPLWTSLLIAALLAYLLNPLVEAGERRWPGKRPLLVPLIYIVVFLLVIGFLLTLGLLIWEQIPNWSRELNSAFLEMRHWLERPITFLGFTLNPQILLDYLQNAAGNAVSTIPLVSGGFFGGVTENLIWTLVVLVSLYYFLRDGRLIRVGMLRRIPYRYRAEITALWQQIDEVWRIFLRAQLLIFFILGLLIIASTSLIIWLFRSGHLPLSPVGLILLLIGVYTAIQQVDNLWLRPQLMGQTLELHPGLVIVSLLAALVLTGLLGALLIVPILATGKVIGRYLYDRFVPQEEAADSKKAAPQPNEEPNNNLWTP
jgi:predicted PurR-regulated permease PerM